MSGNIASGNAASSNGETRNDGHVDGNAQQQLRNEKILNTLSKMNFPQFNGSDKEFRNWVTQIKANLEYVSGERLVGMIESIDPMVRFSHWWNIRAVSIIFAKLLAAVPQTDKSMLMTCGKWTNASLGSDVNGRRYAEGDAIVEVTNLPHPFLALARMEEKYASLNRQEQELSRKA